MEQRSRRLRWWAAGLLAFFVATAFFLPFLPCPPEAHGLGAPRGPYPCGGRERLTLLQWADAKTWMWRMFR